MALDHARLFHHVVELGSRDAECSSTPARTTRMLSMRVLLPCTLGLSRPRPTSYVLACYVLVIHNQKRREEIRDDNTQLLSVACVVWECGIGVAATLDAT